MKALRALTFARGKSKSFLVAGSSKKAVFSFLPFFIFAVLCTSFAGPSSVLAAQRTDQPSGCAGNASPLGNTSRANLDLLCTSGSSFGSLSGGFPPSSLARDLFKEGLFPVGVLSQWSSDNIALALAGNRLNAFSHTYSAKKVPVHLFNSVLTL